MRELNFSEVEEVSGGWNSPRPSPPDGRFRIDLPHFFPISPPVFDFPPAFRFLPFPLPS